MKGNSALEELLISYIADELNEEDKALAERYIGSDEKIRMHVEELRNAWKLLKVNRQLNKIDVDREWNRFEQSITRKENKLTVIKSQEEETGDGEPLQTSTPPDTFRIRKLMPAAAAACLVTLLFLGWIYTGKKIEETKIAYAAPVESALSRSVWHREVNTTARARTLTLEDGSIIVLYSQSEISYHMPFLSDRRDINLIGTADFSVAKDRTKPFTVFSPDLSTTALGTHFRIAAPEEGPVTTVKLTEGKVVVKRIGKDSLEQANAYFLTPGQLLTYNRKKKTVKVEDYSGKKSSTLQNDLASVDMPDLPDPKKGTWYMFNNQLLDQVFDQLSALYHADIVYDKNDMKDIYFIGRYSKTDSLETVLREITKLNNLTVTKQNNQFIIARENDQ